MPNFPLHFRIHFKAPDLLPMDVEVDESAARLYWPTPYDDIAVVLVSEAYGVDMTSKVKEVEWL